jgi:hypothetical protein
MTKLDAMQRAIMNGAAGVTRTIPTAQAQPDPSSAQVVARLKAMLGQERAARVAAETRLRQVLDAVTKMTPRKPQPATAPKKIEKPAAAAVAQASGAEVIDFADIRAAIMRVGGDDDGREVLTGEE